MLTEQDWESANTIARKLVERDCDPNEVHKAFVYLRTRRDSQKFFHLLQRLVKNGGFLVRSRRTIDYYKAMLEVCQQHLTKYRADVKTMSEVLGWAVRLMRFYMADQTQSDSRARKQQQPYRGKDRERRR